MNRIKVTCGLLLVPLLALGILMPVAADLPNHSGRNTAIYGDKGGDRVVYMSNAEISNEIGAGTIGTATGLSHTETGDGVSHKTTLTLAAGTALAVTNADSNGAHGSIKLYTFPVGYTKIIGTTIDVDVACGDTGLDATATYDFGLGSITAGVDNAALATTEQDVIVKIEGNLSSSAAALGKVNSTDLPLDGTTTAEDVWFNVAFEADDASDDETCTLVGTVTLTWVNLGDY